MISVVEITFVEESHNFDLERVQNVANDVEENGHDFTKLNAIRVMFNKIKTLLGKMQN